MSTPWTQFLWCTSVAALQVYCREMLLDLRRNMAQVKCAIKCLPGHPTHFSFQGNPEEGEYDEHFQPIQGKVSAIVDIFPQTHMELLAEVIPSWEC